MSPKVTYEQLGGQVQGLDTEVSRNDNQVTLNTSERNEVLNLVSYVDLKLSEGVENDVTELRSPQARNTDKRYQESEVSPAQEGIHKRSLLPVYNNDFGANTRLMNKDLPISSRDGTETVNIDGFTPMESYHNMQKNT